MSTRILVADDSPFWREELKSMLEEDSDWTVFEARDGFEALQKSNWIRPDIAILDLSMPELDGLGAARELRRRKPALPIVLITVDKSAFLESVAREAGVLAVLSKMECARMKDLITRIIQPKAA